MGLVLGFRRGFACFGLGRLGRFGGLCLGLLVADTREREVLFGGLEQHHRLLDVDVGVELGALLDSFALERRHQRAEIPELDDIAIGDDVLGDLGGVVQDGLDLLAVEGSGLGDTLAEVAEVDAMAACRLGDLDEFSCVFADIELALDDYELQWFVGHDLI